VGSELAANDFCEQPVGLPGFHFDTATECFELPPLSSLVLGRAYYDVSEYTDRPDRLGVFIGVTTELDRNWPGTYDYHHILVGSEVRVTFSPQP
jgi:hypothetical protein